MAEVGPATSRRTRTGDSYANQWNRFAAWSQASGRRSLPASPQDVAAYLEDRLETGARPSTLRLAAAAIARNHKVAGFHVPFRFCAARAVLDDLTRDDTPGPSRALLLDLNRYLAIRRTAQEPRPGRSGRLERAASARNRGALDITMIGLMRDARLRVSEAAALTRGDVRRMRGGSGRVRVGGATETECREVSANTMGLLLSTVRRGWCRPRPGNETEPDGGTDWLRCKTDWPRPGVLGRQLQAGHDPGHGNARRTPAADSAA